MHIYLEKAPFDKALALIERVILNTPEETYLQRLTLICSISRSEGVNQARKEIIPTVHLVRMFLQIPEAMSIFSNNRWGLSIILNDKGTLTHILASKELSNLFMNADHGIPKEITFPLLGLTPYYFLQAAKIYGVDPSVLCDMNLNHLPAKSVDDLLSLAVISKIWRQENEERFKQLLANPATQRMLENSFPHSYSSIQHYAYFFTPETWEIMRVYVTTNPTTFQNFRYLTFADLSDNSDSDDISFSIPDDNGGASVINIAHGGESIERLID